VASMVPRWIHHPPLAMSNESTPTPGAVDIENLLRRHAARERLTPAEYGHLGRHYQKTGTRGPGRPSSVGPARRKAPSPSLATPGPMPGVPGNGLGVPDSGGNPLLAAPMPEPLGQADPPPSHPILDPGSAKAVVGALVDAADRLAQSYVRVSTLRAGGDEQTANRFATAAACPAESRRLIVETSPEYLPPLLGSIGLSGAAVPGGAALVGAAGWGIGLLGVATEIRQLSPSGEGTARAAT
jgi:hypothetical protein